MNNVRQHALDRAAAMVGLLLASVLVLQDVWAVTRHVPVEYSTIQAGIDAAQAGDTILVAPGTYRGPGNRDIELRAKNIVVRSSDGCTETVIDCERGGRGFYVHEWEPPTTRIEGFTIRNGYAPPGWPPASLGGGMYCSSSIAIVDCRFESCEANDGGGLYLIVFDGVVDRCEFFGNYGDERGGGIFYQFGSSAITNCLIQENVSQTGGGVCIDGGAENRLIGCTIAGNACYIGGGGGIRSAQHLRLERCIVRGNCSMLDGPEIKCGHADFLCCDIDRSGVYSVEVTYDADCIDEDPMFCVQRGCGEWEQGDWRLSESSPCLPANSPCGQLIGALGAGCGPSFPPGACCIPGSVCVVMSEFQCTAHLGSYHGDGTTCDPDPCAPTPVEITTWGRIKASYRDVGKTRRASSDE